MKFKLLDRVVLAVDVPDAGLVRGDIGTVVELYAPDGLEVEVFDAKGSTRGVVTMRASQVRPATERELKTPHRRQ